MCANQFDQCFHVYHFLPRFMSRNSKYETTGNIISAITVAPIDVQNTATSRVIIQITQPMTVNPRNAENVVIRRFAMCFQKGNPFV